MLLRITRLESLERAALEPFWNAFQTAKSSFLCHTLTLPHAGIAGQINPTPAAVPVMQAWVLAFIAAADRWDLRGLFFMTAHAAGLRVSEVTSLRVSDIYSQRMVLRIEQGKGRKDRYVMLSPNLLDLLRAYWKVARPTGLLFPGRNPSHPITREAIYQVCLKATKAARLNKKVTVRALRHCFATHLLEAGAKIGFLGVLHTWGQSLLFHPHLHCVVPEGGLSPDRKRWVPSRKPFPLPPISRRCADQYGGIIS